MKMKLLALDHLARISRPTKKGRHVIVVMDGVDDIVNQFNNLSIIKLPPYSSNQNFSGYNGIVDKACIGWNRFNESVLGITKICSIDWINLTN
ncbi:hypothetical protein VXS02_17310 [Photobacterium piscicola]|uniref:hypothetical protein n=1 Tax=Photobacterium piscicola TaxID=1378299 RepID=UPI002E18DE30|nr:hypothetical protein [Photobacterium piscicola]